VKPLPRRPTPGLVAILGALSAFGPLSMDMYLPGLPSLTRDLGASASAGQLTLTRCMLGLAAGQLVAGPMSDSMGRRRLLLTGAALVVTITHAGLVALLISLFAILSGLGIVFPIGTAAALAGQQQSLGGASALLGTGQFGMGALVAPLVGLAGPHDALPMAIVIGTCGTGALAVDVLGAPISQRSGSAATASRT